jgi:hypothetical protein
MRDGLQRETPNGRTALSIITGVLLCRRLWIEKAVTDTDLESVRPQAEEVLCLGLKASVRFRLSPHAFSPFGWSVSVWQCYEISLTVLRDQSDGATRSV